jgi:hypothetical protein
VGVRYAARADGSYQPANRGRLITGGDVLLSRGPGRSLVLQTN